MNGPVTISSLRSRFGRDHFAAAAVIASTHPDWSHDEVAAELCTSTARENEALRARVAELEKQIEARDRTITTLKKAGHAGPVVIGPGAGVGDLPGQLQMFQHAPGADAAASEPTDDDERVV